MPNQYLSFMETNSSQNPKPALKIDEAVKQVFSKYVNFEGRARRSEFWWFVLCAFLVYIVAIVLDNVLDLTFGATPYGPFYYLATLGLIIPYLGVAARRLHDIDKSGWFVLLGFIPVIGLLFLYWCCLDSQPNENQYGPSPKY